MSNFRGNIVFWSFSLISTVFDWPRAVSNFRTFRAFTVVLNCETWTPTSRLTCRLFQNRRGMLVWMAIFNTVSIKSFESRNPLFFFFLRITILSLKLEPCFLTKCLFTTFALLDNERLHFKQKHSRRLYWRSRTPHSPHRWYLRLWVFPETAANLLKLQF